MVRRERRQWWRAEPQQKRCAAVNRRLRFDLWRRRSTALPARTSLPFGEDQSIPEIVPNQQTLFIGLSICPPR